MSGVRYVGGPPRLISIAITIPLDMCAEDYAIDATLSMDSATNSCRSGSWSADSRKHGHVRLIQG